MAQSWRRNHAHCSNLTVHHRLFAKSFRFHMGSIGPERSHNRKKKPNSSKLCVVRKCVVNYENKHPFNHLFLETTNQPKNTTLMGPSD